MSRVSDAITKANADGRAALIVYLPAGFPDMDTSQACLEAAAAAGADLLEVGFPYSDPLMDGPVIQQANQVAMDAGYTPSDDFDMCGRLTAAIDVPAVVMTYYNICWHYPVPAPRGADAPPRPPGPPPPRALTLARSRRSPPPGSLTLARSRRSPPPGSLTLARSRRSPPPGSLTPRTASARSQRLRRGLAWPA
jgi:hypothetical protein